MRERTGRWCNPSRCRPVPKTSTACVRRARAHQHVHHHAQGHDRPSERPAHPLRGHTRCTRHAPAHQPRCMRPMKPKQLRKTPTSTMYTITAPTSARAAWDEQISAGITQTSARDPNGGGGGRCRRGPSPKRQRAVSHHDKNDQIPPPPSVKHMHASAINQQPTGQERTSGGTSGTVARARRLRTKCLRTPCVRNYDCRLLAP